jgi:hypothetical protein
VPMFSQALKNARGTHGRPSHSRPSRAKGRPSGAVQSLSPGLSFHLESLESRVLLSGVDFSASNLSILESAGPSLVFTQTAAEPYEPPNQAILELLAQVDIGTSQAGENAVSGQDDVYTQILTPADHQWQFTDADGDLVTVVLSGSAGSVTIMRAVPGVEAGDMLSMVLTGTTASSKLTITTQSTVSGKVATTTVGDIQVNGSLGSLQASSTSLLGDMTLSGSLGKLVLDDVLGQHTITIGPAASARQTLSMTFDRVEDLSIVSQMPIRSLRATDWLDVLAGDDTIQAPSLGSLSMTGKRIKTSLGLQVVAGDFQADLLLTGGLAGYTLGSASIAGSIANSTWEIDGQAGNITVKGDVDGLDLCGNITGLTALRSLSLGTVTNADISVDGGIRLIKAKQWLSGSILADTLTALKILGYGDAIAGDFGADLTLRGPANAKSTTLGYTKIAGTLAGHWDVTGKVGALYSKFIQSSLDLPNARLTSIVTSTPLIRVTRSDAPKYLLAVGDAGNDYPIRFASLAKWPKTLHDSSANHAPVVQAIGDMSIGEDQLLQFVVNASDSDLDTLTYSCTGLPEGATFDVSTRTFSWTASYSQSGSYDIDFIASDGTSTGVESVTITVGNVNRPPTLSTAGTLSGAICDESFTITYDMLASAGNQADPDGQTLSFLIGSVLSGTLTKDGIAVTPDATLLGPGESLVWQPGAGQSGILGAFTVLAWDGLAVSDSAVNVNVDVHELVNIASLAVVTAQPYTSFLYRAVDGINGTGITPSSNGYVLDRSYEFRFDTAQSISEIRFTLPTNYYSLWADTTGDGTYDTLLLNVSDGPTSQLWGVSEWAYGEWTSQSAITVYGVKLCEPNIQRFVKSGFNGTPPAVGDTVYQWSTDGVLQHRFGTVYAVDDDYVWISEPTSGGYSWGSSGWLSTSNTDATNRWVYSAEPTDVNPARSLYEFQILSDSSLLTPATLEAIAAPALDSDVPDATEGDAVVVAEPAEDEQYLTGVYIEVWMMDLAGWIASSQRGDLRDWPAYQAMVSALQDVGANLVWIMPVRSGFTDGVYNGDWYGSDVLWPSEFIANCSTENYLAIITTALHADGFKVFAEDRPTGWVAKDGVSAEDVIAGGVAEMVASGIDGVAVEWDEGGNQASTDELAQWAAASAAAKAVNPDIMTFTNLAVPEGSNRTYVTFAQTVDTDLLGTDAGYFTFEDSLGHWGNPISTAEMIGANPNGGTIITMNCPWAAGGGSDGTVGAGDNPLFYETFTPVAMYGSALSVAFHGGDAMSYWRLWSYLSYNGYQAYAATGYSMLDTLAAWGGNSAEVPDDILVLASNSQAASFAYYDYVYDILDSSKNGTSYGYNAAQAVYEILLEAGLPYQVGYMEAPQDISLSGVKTIVVSFAYDSNDPAIPDATYALLEQAAAAGIKIIILGRPGTVSEKFSALLASPNVTLLTDDLINGITPTARGDILSAITTALGSDRPTYLNSYGHDVELAMLEDSAANSSFLLVTNWEPNDVTVDVGINLADGVSYTLLKRDLTGTTQVQIDGKTVLSAADLQNFRITLDANESCIFYIQAIS